MLVAVVNKDTVWVAWAGDSRAVMGSMSSTLELSRDHTCALQSEWERVDRAGGKRMVNEQNGSVRVVVPGARPEEFHTLAMSRSIGDKPFHAHGVVATPEIRQFDTSSIAGHAVLLLCSDGVWEYVDNSEAIRCTTQVACRASGSYDAAKACRALMECRRSL